MNLNFLSWNLGRSQWFMFGLAVALTWGASNQLHAQGVAVIDVAAVFKAHPAFTKELDNIRNQAESIRGKAVQIQQEFAAKAEKLKSLDPLTKEFRDAEAELAKEAALLDNSQKDEIRQLMQAEAKLHYDVYQEVNRLIDDFCQSQSITLVLRFSNDPLDETNPESIMQKVNSSIIYHESGRDITPQIVAMLNQSVANGNTSQR